MSSLKYDFDKVNSVFLFAWSPVSFDVRFFAINVCLAINVVEMQLLSIDFCALNMN